MRPLSPVSTLLSLHHLLATAGAAAITTAAPQVTAAPQLTAPVYPGVPTQTRTSTYTSRSYTGVFQPGLWSRTYTLISTVTRTVTQPGPFPASALPVTVTQLVASRVVFETRITESGPGRPGIVSGTEFSTWTGAGAETFVVHAARPTPQVAAAANLDGPPRPLPLPLPAAAEAPACAERGLQTVCLEQQCDVVDGQFWCLTRTRDEALMGRRLPMGRACHDGHRAFEQLFTPCLPGDEAIQCNGDGTYGCGLEAGVGLSFAGT